MKDLLGSTLAELVVRETSAAAVFEKYHLDFCCKGKRTLEAACQSQGLDTGTVARELEEVFAKPGTAGLSYFLNLPLGQLADYIVERHHGYVRQMMPLLTAHTQKVAERHGKSHPELERIAELWAELALELGQHMNKEEQILFPYIRRLAAMNEVNDLSGIALRQFVANPIRTMEMEHEKAGGLMAEIRRLSSNYTPPLVACTTYRLCFNELREFGEDLHWHVYLENNLLFPQAIKLEASLNRLVYQ